MSLKSRLVLFSAINLVLLIVCLATARMAGISGGAWVIMLCTVAGSIGVAIWAWLYGSGAHTRLMDSVATIKKFAKGDLTGRTLLSGTPQDEIDTMASEVNGFGESIAGVISEIYAANRTLVNAAASFSTVFGSIAHKAESMNGNSNTVAAAAEEASVTVNSISAAAEEMSSSVMAVATAMEEMSSSINEVARSCQEESRIAADAERQVSATHETVTRLGTQAHEIGRIINTIADIAAKTNLLALNATIEAASAGDAGRGFAVVANEVKELARQTAAATKEIRGQIEGIQAGVKGSVDSMDAIASIIQRVNEVSQTIVAAVEEQSATANEVSGNIAGASQAANDIALNVAETAKGINEVSAKIQRVNSETAEVTTSLRESGSSVRELNALGTNLEKVVSSFNIKANLLEWSEKLSVGIPEMDTQHRKLIAMINDLNTAISGGKAAGTIGPILSGLVDYTATHFAQEEKLLESHNYAELPGHRRIHEQFVAKVVALKDDFASGKALLSRDIMLFLKDWLVTHIMGTDRKYGSAITGKKLM